MRIRDVFALAGARSFELFGTPFWRPTLAHSGAPTFARASVSEAIGKTARSYLASGALRVEWAMDTDRGELVPTIALAPSVDQLLLRSEELATAPWAAQLATVTADSTTGPTGEATADRITETATTGVHNAWQAYTIADDADVAFSIWLKAGTVTEAFLQIEGKLTPHEMAFFDLAAGRVTAELDGAKAFMIPYADGWWRCGLVANVGTGVNTPLVRVGSSDGNQASSFLGNTGNYFYAWGAMLSTGRAVGPSLRAAGSAPTTHAAETLSVEYPERPIGVTLFVDFDWGLDIYVAGRDAVVHIGDGAAGNPSAGIRFASNGRVELFHHNGTELVSATGDAAAWNRPGKRWQVRMVLAADGSVYGDYRVRDEWPSSAWTPLTAIASSGAPAGGLGSAWSAPALRLFSNSGGSAAGRLYRLTAARGAHGFDEIRAAFAAEGEAA